MSEASSSVSLSNIRSMDQYLDVFGRELGDIASNALDPLHVPGMHPIPDYSIYPKGRRLFDPQAHTVVGLCKTLDEQGSEFLVGEMGAGKTIMSMMIVDTHANKRHLKPDNPRGKGYVCVVLCPDGIISKWKKEIEATIKDAEVVEFRSKKGDPDWQQAYRYFNSLRQTNDHATEQAMGGARWKRPDHPLYIVLGGREQVKRAPGWTEINSVIPHPATKKKKDQHGLSVKQQANARLKLDENKQPVYDQRGRPRYTHELIHVNACPRCGGVPHDKHGNPLPKKELEKQSKCNVKYLEEIPADHKRTNGLDVMVPGNAKRMYESRITSPVGEVVKKGNTSYVVKECGEPLWQYIPNPRRYPIATFMHKKCKKLIDYVIVDEIHEQKAQGSGRGVSSARIMAIGKHTIAMTGTLIGGYADHLYYLMFRISPQTLVDEGFVWDTSDAANSQGVLAFSQKYGRVDTIITTKEQGSEVTVTKNQRSTRRARGGGRNVRRQVKPGTMPQLFGRHLIGNTAFLTLKDMSDELPELDEVPVPCKMEPAQALAYDLIHGKLEAEAKDMLARGSMKLLSTYLRTTLDYPDRPFDWVRPYPTKEAVGYYDQPNDKREDNFVGIIDPPSLPKEKVYPKERALIDLCKEHKKKGDQTWVYVEMTGTRSILPRLKKLLEAEGLKVGVLETSTTQVRDRGDWIETHGKKVDVMISHPVLVGTGMDLFSKSKDGHNFNVIAFYQTGYNAFTLRQASRRAWRIAQPKDCKVYYLFYVGTMQEQAMNLMADKMLASTALEGQFSSEGLLAMAGDESNAQVAMARAVNEKLDDEALARKWSKIKSAEQTERKKPRHTPEEINAIEEQDDFDPPYDEGQGDEREAPGLELGNDIAWLDGDDEDTDDALAEMYASKPGPGPAGPRLHEPGDGDEEDEPEPNRCDSCAAVTDNHDPNGPTLCDQCAADGDDEVEPEREAEQAAAEHDEMVAAGQPEPPPLGDIVIKSLVPGEQGKEVHRIKAEPDGFNAGTIHMAAEVEQKLAERDAEIEARYQKEEQQRREAEKALAPLLDVKPKPRGLLSDLDDLGIDL